MTKRGIDYSALVNVKKQLYVSLVRCHLEYCVPVWSRLSKENSLIVERVQRAATRYILDFIDIQYNERLQRLDLSPLSIRIEIAEYILQNFFFLIYLDLTYICIRL